MRRNPPEGRDGALIYLLEDDSSIRNFVEYALVSSGLETRGFERPSDFWRELDKCMPSLLLLDIMLPEEDGLEILRKLRERQDTKKLPVIMLTARGTEYDKVLGLDRGADDYIAKPFGIMELLSRVRALLRRTEPEAGTEDLSLGGITLSPATRTVRVNGETVFLTHKEFELLELLLSKPGAVFPREKILSSVWGTDFDGESRTLDVHIRTLRGKLGVCGGQIKTVRGIGYKMEDKL